MAELELHEFAVTELAQAPIDGMVVAASWPGGLTKATVGKVARHTPGGRIVLADGTQFARSGDIFKMYGGNTFVRLYRADPALIEAVRAAKDAERKKREASRALYNIHDKTVRLGHAATADDHAAATSLDAIISAWPLPQDIAGKLAEIAAELVARQSAALSPTEAENG